jgi:hypothetical protein
MSYEKTAGERYGDEVAWLRKRLAAGYEMQMR